MSAAFTPGPWRVSQWRVGHRQRQRAIYGKTAPGHYPEGVLAHTMGSRLPEMNDANAYLIAAAPELYEALEAVCHEFVSHDEGCDLDPQFGTGGGCTCGASETQASAEAILAKARGEAA